MIIKKITTYGDVSYYRRKDNAGFTDREPVKVAYYLFGIRVLTCRYIRNYEGAIPYEDWCKTKDLTSS